MKEVDIRTLHDRIAACARDERLEIFRKLRAEFPIHPLEAQLGTTAEIILEAIARSSDLTLRGVRGVIAEAAFAETVIEPLSKSGWSERQIQGDQSYDFLIADSNGEVKIQVKMQRQKEQRPMTAEEASKRHFLGSAHMWVVETQRTRGGKDSNGADTRPYKYGEFDILAVALHPSTGSWSDFVYTVGDWLLEDPENHDRIYKYQPVPRKPNSDWTSSLIEAIDWFRRGIVKKISIS